jgi:hypothetical protein
MAEALPAQLVAETTASALRENVATEPVTAAYAPAP